MAWPVMHWWALTELFSSLGDPDSDLLASLAFSLFGERDCLLSLATSFFGERERDFLRPLADSLLGDGD